MLKLEQDYVFAGGRRSAPLSNMAMLNVLSRMDVAVTVHGFRSTFRDWAAERTAFSHEVCEMTLAHTIQNSAEAAYRRGDLFEKRRKLMHAWGDFLDTPRECANVSTIRRAA
jgi:integrase